MRVGGKKLVAVVVAAVLLAGIAYLLVYAYQRPHINQSSKAIPVPEELAGIPLARHVSGEEAVKTVVGIHWEKVPVEKAAIAEYGSNGRLYFRLWVAVVNDPCRLVDEMAEKMREYASVLPYTAPRPINHTVLFYVTIDKRDGTLHVFWCEPPYVIWLHIYDRRLTLEALREVVDFYRR